MQDKTVRCALISPDEEFRRVVRAVLPDPTGGSELVLEMPGPVQELRVKGLQRLMHVDPQVVILDLGDDPLIGLMGLRLLSEEAPNLLVLVAGPVLEAEPLLEVMRAGAGEYLPKPVSEGDLASALGRTVRKLGRGQPRKDRHVCEVFSVFSPKGGTGVTTTAANLAVHLRRVTGERTLLLDLDLEFGTAALVLALWPRFSVLDLVRNFHRADESLLESYVEEHASGVHVLAAPAQADDPRSISREQARSLMRFLRRHYRYIVVDLGRSLTPLSFALLEDSDQSFLVATPELPTLRNINRVLPLLNKVGGGASERMRVVLNCYAPAGDITLGEVKEALGLDVFWKLGLDPDAVKHSLNAGRPIVLNGSSRYSKDIKELGEQLAGPQEGGEDRKGLFGAFLRPFRRGSPAPKGQGD